MICMFIHSPSLLLKLIDISSVGNTIYPLKKILIFLEVLFLLKTRFSY